MASVLRGHSNFALAFGLRGIPPLLRAFDLPQFTTPMHAPRRKRALHEPFLHSFFCVRAKRAKNKSPEGTRYISPGQAKRRPGYTATKFYFPLPIRWGEGGRRPGEGIRFMVPMYA